MSTSAVLAANLARTTSPERAPPSGRTTSPTRAPSSGRTTSPTRAPSSARTTSPTRAPTSGTSGSSQRGQDGRMRLSPSTVGSVYPALENLQRISQGHSSSASQGGITSTEAAATSSRQQRQAGLTSVPQPTFPSVQTPGHVAHPVVPGYRQVGGAPDSHGGSGHPSSSTESPPYQLESTLPDILYSHMVSQAPQPRPNQHRQHRNRNRRPGEEGSGRGHRHRHRGHGDRSRHHRRSRTQSSSSAQTQEGTCKEPCVKCVVTLTSFRWVLVVLSVLGVFCVITGIVLAALHAAGNSFLFLAIMFIGLGVLLVIVVGVGWKCTPRGHEPLHALFGIGSFRRGQTRERRPRRHRNRDGNWFGGVLYPEFQYRRPPPSYAASMQDYQNQVTQEQEPNPNPATSNGDSLPSSPPPSYRSRASTVHSGVHAAFPSSGDGDQPSSRPPTYRSRAPSRRPSIPREETPRTSTADSDGGDAPPPDISFAGPSTVYISQSDGPSGRVTVSSVSPRHIAGTTSITQTTTSISPTVSDHTTAVRTGRTDNQNLTPPTGHTVSPASQVTAASSTSSPHHLKPATAGQTGSRVPSLHQRMASEDRQILEQTLQSLEEHMNEGISNRGATFDPHDVGPDHINTHL